MSKSFSLSSCFLLLPPWPAPEKIQLAKVTYGLPNPSPWITEQSVAEWLAPETQALNIMNTCLWQSPLHLFTLTTGLWTFCKKHHLPRISIPWVIILRYKIQISISFMGSSWINQRKQQGRPWPSCCIYWPPALPADICSDEHAFFPTVFPWWFKGVLYMWCTGDNWGVTS